MQKALCVHTVFLFPSVAAVSACRPQRHACTASIMSSAAVCGLRVCSTGSALFASHDARMPATKGASPLPAQSKMLPVDMADLHGRRGKAVRDFLVPYTNATQLVETDGFRGILNGISIVAVLIVTVTFIGMQTPPGGGSDGEGGQLKLCRMGTNATGHSLCDGQKMAINQTALKTYVVLDGLSLFWAAADLLLVLAFLLPGVSKRYRAGQRVAWVWCMLVSCSLLLAASLVCAVGAFVAAGFTVVPAEEHCLLYVILACGGCVLAAALALLFYFIDSARSPDTHKFIWEELLGRWARGPEARAPPPHPAAGLLRLSLCLGGQARRTAY